MNRRRDITVLNIDVRLVVLIPTLNNVDIIDETIESIFNQQYDKNNIYLLCMDFGSNDGTYNKLLSYAGKNVGVYQDNTTKNRRLMIAKMSRMLRYVSPGGYYCYYMVVYPGEKLYPNCLSKLAMTMIKYQADLPSGIICEADIEKKDGTIVHQKPMYDTDKILYSDMSFSEYTDKGYDHQIHTLKTFLLDTNYRLSGEANEGRWWNKCARINFERKVVYIKEPLIIEKPIEYEDELEEILLRWEALINQIRAYEAKYRVVCGVERIDDATFNLANYALWRSKILLEKGNNNEAEDCLMISSIINKKIEKSDDYQHLMKEIKK